MYADPTCERFTSSKAQASLLSILSTLAIVAINLSLERALRAFAEFEGHASVEARNLSLSFRLVIAQFFNTAVLTVLVNVAFPGAGGGYADLSRAWYDSVGSSSA
jgi:hypothetical protein